MKEKKISYIQVVCKIFVLVLRAAPLWIILDSTAMLLSSVCYAFSTVIKQWLFDTITNVTVGKENYYTLIIVTVVVVLFQIVNELLNAVCNFTWSPALKSVIGKLKQKIHLKVARLPGNCFEDVKTLECLEKANMGADRCYEVYNSLATIFLFYVPYFFVIGIYLWRLKPILTLALGFIFVPLMVNLLVRKKIFERQVDDTVPLQREKDYYETEIFSREKLKENRLYGSYYFFKDKFFETNRKFCTRKWKAIKKSAIIELIMRSLTLAGYLGVIILLVFSMMDGSISVGAFAAVFSSITTLISFMNDAIGNYLSTLFEIMGVLKKYLEFFELPEDEGMRGQINWEHELSVRNLSFSYPGSEKKVLDHVSFDIHGGETVALVGENGAGKSTLVRILSGILHPDEGEVWVDGENLFAISPEDRFRNTSAVFQKFMKYQMSVRENVMISSSEKNDGKMIESLDKGEFSMDDRFVDGYDTMLSREFDGIDLSGGQWQRLAVARGLYRDSRFMVLDEPTSAIDPIEEGIMYRKFQELINNKMGIIVTHRLGSTKMADRILVLKSGKLVENGTHGELMKKNGYYASLYQEQAQWYQNEVREG